MADLDPNMSDIYSYSDMETRDNVTINGAYMQFIEPSPDVTRRFNPDGRTMEFAEIPPDSFRRFAYERRDKQFAEPTDEFRRFALERRDMQLGAPPPDDTRRYGYERRDVEPPADGFRRLAFDRRDMEFVEGSPGGTRRYVIDKRDLEYLDPPVDATRPYLIDRRDLDVFEPPTEAFRRFAHERQSLGDPRSCSTYKLSNVTLDPRTQQMMARGRVVSFAPNTRDNEFNTRRVHKDKPEAVMLVQSEPTVLQISPVSKYSFFTDRSVDDTPHSMHPPDYHFQRPTGRDIHNRHQNHPQHQHEDIAVTRTSKYAPDSLNSYQWVTDVDVGRSSPQGLRRANDNEVQITMVRETPGHVEAHKPKRGGHRRSRRHKRHKRRDPQHSISQSQTSMNGTLIHSNTSVNGTPSQSKTSLNGTPWQSKPTMNGFPAKAKPTANGRHKHDKAAAKEKEDPSFKMAEVVTTDIREKGAISTKDDSSPRRNSHYENIITKAYKIQNRERLQRIGVILIIVSIVVVITVIIIIAAHD